MTAAERLIWTRIQRRVASMTPEMAAAILRAFQNVRDSMSEGEIARTVALGGADRLFNDILAAAVLDAAYAPVRQRIREHLIQGVRAYGRVLPVRSAREVTIAFDYLNPRMIDAIRGLESTVITELNIALRQTTRAVVEQGLREGAPVRTIAKELRSSVGLGPSQVKEVQNLRDALAGVNGRRITDYNLRDRTVDRLLKKGPLTPAQIDRYAEKYRKARIANNAATTAQTTARDTQKLSQKLSWQDAIEKGIVDGDRLMKTWVTVGDNRVRDDHLAMAGQTVPFAARFSNGEDVPGESTYNCRCVPRYFQARAS